MNESKVGSVYNTGLRYGFQYLQHRNEYVRHLSTKSKKKIIIRIEVDEWCVFISVGNNVVKISNEFEDYRQALAWQALLDLPCLFASIKQLK